MKPYRNIAIQECGEECVPIPREEFAFFDPHPYVALGAPYGGASPWFLRARVLYALQRAQRELDALKPGWKMLLFDAYRPNAVQAFMVEREVTIMAQTQGLDAAALTPEQRAALLAQAYRIFAIPSDDPATPPPHSTGAAIDLTLADDRGREVDMGSPIDENSPRSSPDYFIAAADDAGKTAHANRVLLNNLMLAQGFRRNPSEWWHFSRGDQLAVWVEHGAGTEHFAIYGRADLV